MVNEPWDLMLLHGIPGISGGLELVPPGVVNLSMVYGCAVMPLAFSPDSLDRIEVWMSSNVENFFYVVLFEKVCRKSRSVDTRIIEEHAVGNAWRSLLHLCL